ncbi:HAMP domain-containing protein [Kibdelosporangium aridum]|uniref:histidine kinase n=1 Tax=Kibdelosporangium aridum TaxID=2030 RepID=A0A428ZMX1_KIBAR|nr:nitrate- and nitrite sensing domain-containing protein [Kibdelosporangium aridum]RSM89402.1 HAMP domain-containing protein [Kibdelosporangium aridum]
MKHLKRPPGRDGNTTLLGRLGIRGKLNLLLLLPLAAVLMVATPFVIVQANSAASAGQTADAARYTREVGGLVWELQRERLLTAAYLASPSSDSGAMERQQRKVDETVGQVRSSLGTDMSDELASALVRIGSLNELREGALRRGISADSVARTYHAVVDAVINSLRLVPQVTSDAEGTRQLTALEALLRANEYGELRGMALIATALNRTTGEVLLEDSTQQAKMFTERFVQQADVEHATLVVQVAEGDPATAVEGLTARMPTDTRNAAAVEAFANDALTTVGAQSGLRRTVQDRVTSQLTDAATARADSAQTIAWLVGGGAAALIALVAFLTVIVSRAIASPLKQLTDAATNVAQLAETELVRVSDTETPEAQRPRLTEIKVSTSDEIGQLAVAFNRVQSTAAQLVERQAITRHNVSLMFANVAQRTQNLVGRQLALVDELERNEQDSRLLERLYRLDHLSTRLRRSADNLLVVAGTRTDTGLGGPMLLANAMRSALAEIEDYQRVQLGDMHDVTCASSLGSDLVLVFAELLENATSFSPPDTHVEVSAAFTNEGACVISIVDHGIGMKPPQMAEENRRLVDRERLDVAPTSVLGLFVVGRLARRHSLAVDLIPTHGGGVTARVAIPAALFTRPAPATPPSQPAAPAAQPSPAVAAHQGAARARLEMPSMPEMRIPPAQQSSGFSWFPDGDFSAEPAPSPMFEPTSQPMSQPMSQPPAVPAPATAPAAPPVAEPQPVATAPAPAAASSETRGGFKRRVAGAQIPGGAVIPSTPTVVTAPVAKPEPVAARSAQHDPAAARAAMDGFQEAFAKAAAAPVPATVGAAPAAEPLSRDGLTRRVPGANLAPGLRTMKTTSAPPLRAKPKYKARDPEAEKASLDAFSSGLARAGVREEPVDTDPMKESTT